MSTFKFTYEEVKMVLDYKVKTGYGFTTRQEIEKYVRRRLGTNFVKHPELKKLITRYIKESRCLSLWVA